MTVRFPIAVTGRYGVAVIGHSNYNTVDYYRIISHIVIVLRHNFTAVIVILIEEKVIDIKVLFK